MLLETLLQHTASFKVSPILILPDLNDLAGLWTFARDAWGYKVYGTLCLSTVSQILTVPKTCSPHTRAWAAHLRAGRHCREYIWDFQPDLNLIYNWGNTRRVVAFHNIWQTSARKHRACQGENKTLMIEDRRRKSNVRQEILLWRISRSLPAFYPGRVSLGLLSHHSLGTQKRENAKPDQETRINTSEHFYFLCIHMCVFLFVLHPSSVSLHLPLGEQGPTALCTSSTWDGSCILKCMVHLRLWHLTALQGNPGLWGPTHSSHNTRTSHSHSVLSYKKQKQGHLDGA